ncbi:MAG: LysR family transcriptional regulator [Rhodospirillales bacterium]|nr:LysR family transcriptional regulator [Rhodospirillales bacterium]
MALHNFSLRELEFFRETIRAGSASRAAERLGVSQPAVSRALSRLEQGLGYALFNRNEGHLVPTSAAWALDEELEPVFSGLGKIARISEHTTSSDTEILRVAAPPTFSICLLQPLIASFVGLYPQARFQLEICSSPESIQKIAMGEADIGMSNTTLSHDGIRFQNALEINAVCIMRDDHPLASRSRIVAEDLDRVPFIAMARSMSSRYSLDRIFEKSGISPDIIAEVTTSYSSCAFVARGMGVGIISPFPALDGPFRNLVARPFSPGISFRVRLMTPAKTNSGWLAQAFQAFLMEQTARQYAAIAKTFTLPPSNSQ